MRIKSLLLVFMITSELLLAQSNILVLDQDSLPISTVNALFVEQDIQRYTDQNGVLYLEEKLPENCPIQFYKQGYATKLYTYEKDTPIIVILKKLHVDLDEVGVVESFNILGNSKLINIEKKTIEDNFLKYQSLLSEIAQISGVDIISSGIGIQKVVVRGLSGMRVVSYLNGIQINNQQWANDHGIGFTGLGLGKVELIKGSSALKYGSEAIGGLLYFQDSPFIHDEKLNGFVSSKFNNSSNSSNNQFGLKFNNKNIYLNVFGQYAISSDYRLPNNDYLFNSRFQQNAFKFSFGYSIKGVHNILRYQQHSEEVGLAAHTHEDPSTVELIDLTSSSIDFSDYKATRPTQFVKNQLITHESKVLIDDFAFKLHLGHFINDLQEYEKWTQAAFDLTLSNTQVLAEMKYLLNNFTFNIGSQTTVLNNTNNISKRIIPDASTTNIGYFGIVDYEKNNTGFNIGVRYDHKTLSSDDSMLEKSYDQQFTSTSFSSGVYQKYDNHTVRLSYSEAYRAPHVAELFSNGVHHGTNRFEIGNRDLKIEDAGQFDIKYQWSNEHFGFVLNPFLQNIKNFISISPTDSFFDQYKVYNYVQYQNVELKGFEMNLHYHPHRLHNLHFEQSYSFIQAENKYSDYGMALVPANNFKTIVLLDFSSFKNLEKNPLDYFSVHNNYTFTQDNFAEYEQRTEAYNVIHLYLGLSFFNDLKCALSINNVLNTEYTPHISRIRGVAGGIPNPGRSFEINLHYEF